MFVYSDPLPSFPPPTSYQHLNFSLGPASINLISKMSVLKIYCKTQNNNKSSKGLFPVSPTSVVLVTVIRAPTLPNNLHSWFIPWSSPLVSHTAHASFCAWTLLWRKPTTSLQSKAEIQLCRWAAL